METKKELLINEKATDFELYDHTKELFKLSNFKNKKILLSFHPLAWTPICAKQMKNLEENYEKFNNYNTIAVGISIDSVPTKNAWAKELDIKNTRLLSDFWPHGQVAEQYNIFRNNEGISERVNIIIDENQKIIFKKIYEISKLPDIKEILDFLKQ
jgi:peroxiredoxin